eukprot:GFUD01024202.1.p1 GENE.GFUD01024202.1~~GFUD01024202.1.p1  ORF type:complete len:356 (+),score=87.45 GFUD01024202.1:96-1163(+)
MSSLSRIPTQDFDRYVTAVAMNDRFILIGKADGSLSAVYGKNGVKVFSSQISEAEITAVCCEEQSEYSNSIFYAGDIMGNLFTVNQKGKVVAQVQLQGRKGEIHTIVNRNKFSIYAYTTTGNITFSHATTDFKKGHFSTASANFSFDGDGTFHKKKGTGDFKVNQYDCRTPTNVVATCGIEFGKKIKNFQQLFAFGIFDPSYQNMIEEGTAENTLPVFCSLRKLIRTLEFPAPVMQVMSCRHHEAGAEDDKIYILLWDGNILKVTGSMLEDPDLSNDDLDIVPAVSNEVLVKKRRATMKIKISGAVMEDSDINNYVLDQENVEDDDKGEYKGFCVYGKKMCVYGNDGLFTADTFK